MGNQKKRFYISVLVAPLLFLGALVIGDPIKKACSEVFQLDKVYAPLVIKIGEIMHFRKQTREVNTTYKIIVRKFVDIEQAKMLQKTLSSQGFFAQMEENAYHGKRIYTIVMWPFKSSQEAKVMSEKMKTKAGIWSNAIEVHEKYGKNN